MTIIRVLRSMQHALLPSLANTVKIDKECVLSFCLTEEFWKEILASRNTFRC